MKSNIRKPGYLVLFLIIYELVMMVLASLLYLFVGFPGSIMTPFIMIVVNIILFYYILPRLYNGILSERILLIFYIVVSTISSIAIIFGIIQMYYNIYYEYFVMLANRIVYPLFCFFYDELYDSDYIGAPYFTVILILLTNIAVNLANYFIYRLGRKKHIIEH